MNGPTRQYSISWHGSIGSSIWCLVSWSKYHNFHEHFSRHAKITRGPNLWDHTFVPLTTIWVCITPIPYTTLVATCLCFFYKKKLFIYYIWMQSCKRTTPATTVWVLLLEERGKWSPSPKARNLFGCRADLSYDLLLLMFRCSNPNRNPYSPIRPLSSPVSADPLLAVCWWTGNAVPIVYGLHASKQATENVTGGTGPLSPKLNSKESTININPLIFIMLILWPLLKFLSTYFMCLTHNESVM